MRLRRLAVAPALLAGITVAVVMVAAPSRAVPGPSRPAGATPAIDDSHSATAPRGALSPDPSTAPAGPPAAADSASTPASPGPGDHLSARVAAWHLPQGVSRSAVLTDGASFLVLGGLDPAAASTATVVRIDPAAGVATDAGRLATPTHDAAGALIGSTAFVFGGGQRVSSDTVQSFAPGSGSARGGSRIAGRLPRARADLSAVSLDGRVYLVGGWDGSSLLPAVLETDDGVRFRTAATLPVAVRYAAATAADGAIWVFGGERNGSATPVVQRIDPSDGRATLVGRLPVAVSGASAITLGGSIYLVGGRVAGTPTNRIWRFDPANRTCYPAGTLPYPVANASAAVAGDVAYLIGGEGRGTLETVIVLRRAGQVPTPAG